MADDILDFAILSHSAVLTRRNMTSKGLAPSAVSQWVKTYGSNDIVGVACISLLSRLLNTVANSLAKLLAELATNLCRHCYAVHGRYVVDEGAGMVLRFVQAVQAGNPMVFALLVTKR